MGETKGVAPKPVKDLDKNTKKMYYSKILRVKNKLGIDWIEKYKSETGKDVDLSGSDIETKMELLEFIYDDKDRRTAFNSDLKKLESNKTKKEPSKVEESNNEFTLILNALKSLSFDELNRIIVKANLIIEKKKEDEKKAIEAQIEELQKKLETL